MEGFGYLYNHPASSKTLRELAKTTMWSFNDLIQLKTRFNLTDYGVQGIIDYCAPIGVNPFPYLEAIQTLANGHTVDYSLLK
jgi:hypothetical protein